MMEMLRQHGRSRSTGRSSFTLRPIRPPSALGSVANISSCAAILSSAPPAKMARHVAAKRIDHLRGGRHGLNKVAIGGTASAIKRNHFLKPPVRYFFRADERVAVDVDIHDVAHRRTRSSSRAHTRQGNTIIGSAWLRRLLLRI